jgi:quercetin dioxygenase-like cupin family protein
MADVTVKRTEDFEPIFHGGMLRARAGLGVTSFGMQILRFPPNADRYPEHDHAADGQEEVYLVLEGAATLTAGDEQHELVPGVFARIGPQERRRLATGETGALILALGGVPGRPFEVTQFTEEGEPDPLAAG